MMVAYELHMSMFRFYQEVDQDELGWWLAYIKLKNEREEKAAETRRRRRGKGG